MAAPEGAATDRVRPQRRVPKGRAPGEPRNVAYLYILPGLAAYGLFTLYPLVQTVHLSFFSWDGLTPREYVGLGNFRQIWDDPEIRAAVQALARADHLVLDRPDPDRPAPDRAPDALHDARVHVLPHGAVPAADDRHRRRRPGLRRGSTTPSARSTGSSARSGSARWERPWLADFNWALTVDRLDRHVDRVRPLHGALPRGRAEDPDHAVRGRAHRRRRLLARAHRGDAARGCGTSSSWRRR